MRPGYVDSASAEHVIEWLFCGLSELARGEHDKNYTPQDYAAAVLDGLGHFDPRLERMWQARQIPPEFEESQHPREPHGPGGGQFATKPSGDEGAGGGAAGVVDEAAAAAAALAAHYKAVGDHAASQWAASGQELPRTPDQIVGDKVKFPTLYQTTDHLSKIDTGPFGSAIYLTATKGAAATDDAHELADQFPEQVIFYFGGREGPATLAAANGIVLWEGNGNPADISKALDKIRDTDVFDEMMVVGTPDSSAPNTVAIFSEKKLNEKKATAKAEETKDELTKSGKKKTELKDFDADIAYRVGSDEENEKFLERWNETVDMTPQEFKDQFLGGLEGDMSISYFADSDSIKVHGNITDEAGNIHLAEFDRTIDFDDQTAESEWFKVTSNERGQGIGKKLMAGNMDMYEKLGIQTVDVHANIDVGGYAWARYGYVPTDESWERDLVPHIEEKLDEMAGGQRPERWRDIDSYDQDAIFERWKDENYNDFYDQAEESWRESGQPVLDAKEKLAEDYSAKDQWANNAVDKVRSQTTLPPWSNEEILQSFEVRFSGRDVDDPDIEFNENNVPEKYQPSELTPEMRDAISEAMKESFNGRAEDVARDAEVPSDLVLEAQQAAWDEMHSQDKFNWAEENGMLEDIRSEGSGDMDSDTADSLRSLVQSGDPRAVWAIADSEYGKELLIDTDWYGSIDLNDRDTMERFNNYTRRK